MFDVAVEYRGSYGPLSYAPKSLMTDIDPKAAPRDVKVSLDGPLLIKIKWRSSCDISSQRIGYRVIYGFIYIMKRGGLWAPDTICGRHKAQPTSFYGVGNRENVERFF